MSAQPSSRDGQQFSLAVWNLLQGLDSPDGRRALRPNVDLESHLRELNADVLVLPEAWAFRTAGATMAEDLAANLGYELHQWTSGEPSRARDRVPWRMVVMTRIPVRRLGDLVFPKLGSYGQRGAVRVELLDSGITIAGVHMLGIHALKRGPRLWFEERAAFREVARSHDIVAGDMNIWGPVASRDAPGLRRAVKGRTYPSTRPHSQIDHILVGHRLDVIESAVLPHWKSDHRAVRAALRIGSPSRS